MCVCNRHAPFSNAGMPFPMSQVVKGGCPAGWEHPALRSYPSQSVCVCVYIYIYIYSAL